MLLQRCFWRAATFIICGLLVNLALVYRAKVTTFTDTFAYLDTSSEGAHLSPVPSIKPHNLNHRREDSETKEKRNYDPLVVENHPNLLSELVPPTTAGELSLPIPDLTGIRWSGNVYQESWKHSPKFLLYSAAFEPRIKGKLDVRILGLYDGGKLKSDLKLFCKFWYKNNSESQIPIRKAYLIDSNINLKKIPEDLLVPYMLTCSVNNETLPFAVSVVQHTSATPNNILKIVGSARNWPNTDEPPIRKEIRLGICGKALFYYNEDFSSRLIEWVEIMKALGVSKIILYKTACHENVQKVLKFYERDGFVKLISFSYPPPYVHEPTYLRYWTKTKKHHYRGAQKIYINDCLLRFKDEFDYLMVMDADEVPILKVHKTLPLFLKYIQSKFKRKKEKANIFLKWKHFYTNLVPKHSKVNNSEVLYDLSHTMRSKLIGPEAKLIETNGKTIYDTKKISIAGIHLPYLKKTDPNFCQKKISIDRKTAYIGHFGDKICNSECQKKFFFEEEHFLLQHKYGISKAVKSVRKSLKLSP